MENYLISYIFVLGHSETIKQLTIAERTNTEIMGCLVSLEEALKKEPDVASTRLLAKVKEREEINGRSPVGDTMLEETTQECAEMCLAYLRERFS